MKKRPPSLARAFFVSLVLHGIGVGVLSWKLNAAPPQETDVRVVSLAALGNPIPPPAAPKPVVPEPKLPEPEPPKPAPVEPEIALLEPEPEPVEPEPQEPEPPQQQDSHTVTETEQDLSPSEPTLNIVAPGGDPRDIDRYLSEVSNKINAAAHRSYPSKALRRRLEGQVTIHLTIAPDGRLVDLKAVDQEPAILVKAALKAVRKAAPFPPFPSSLANQGNVTLKTPVVYRIVRN